MAFTHFFQLLLLELLSDLSSQIFMYFCLSPDSDSLCHYLYLEFMNFVCFYYFFIESVWVNQALDLDLGSRMFHRSTFDFREATQWKFPSSKSCLARVFPRKQVCTAKTSCDRQFGCCNRAAASICGPISVSASNPSARRASLNRPVAFEILKRQDVKSSSCSILVNFSVSKTNFVTNSFAI